MASPDCFCVSFHEVEIMTMMIGRETLLYFVLQSSRALHTALGCHCPLRLSGDFITTTTVATLALLYRAVLAISSWQGGRLHNSPSLEPPSSCWISWKDRIFSSLWSRPALGQFWQCSPLITVWPYPGQILINPPSRSAFVELLTPHLCIPVINYWSQASPEQ